MKVVFGAMVVRGFVVCRLIDVVTSDGSSLANSFAFGVEDHVCELAADVVRARLDESALLAIGDESSFAHP